MGFLSNIKRAIAVGTQQIWRNKFLSLTTIGIGVLLFFLLSSVIGVRQFTQLQLTELQKRADYSVLLAPDYDAFVLEGLLNALQQQSATATILPPSEFMGVQVGASLRVKLLDLEQTPDVFETLKSGRYSDLFSSWSNDEEASFRNIIEQLLSIREGVTAFSLALILLFTIGGIFLMGNTFQMLVFSRKDEVEVARMLGAKSSFILLPFLWEGALLGIIAAVISMLLFGAMLTQLGLPFAGQIFAYMVDNVYIWQIVGGAVIGILGAWLAVWQYLRT